MTGRIAALGDSISCGEGVGLRVPSTAVWPARLAATTPGGELIPLARPGARLEDVRRVQLPVALEQEADAYTLLIGLNDLSRSGFDPERFATELAHTVTVLRDTGALVLLGRLHDATALLRLPGRLRHAIRQRTATINAAVDACRGDRVRVLDLAALAGLRMRQAWDVDRVHPNVAGHAIIARAAARVLREAGWRIGPVRQPRLPPGPGRLREAEWLLRHGVPWVSGHVPQVVVPAVAATLHAGRPST